MVQPQLPPQQPNSNMTLARQLGRVGVGILLTLTATGLGGVWYGRYFLNERLSPLLQSELSKALKRPLQLGQVERVGLSSIRFGKSIVPPTEQEANFLAVDALEVNVDLWGYITRRQLGLDAIAERPQVFLKQDVTGLLQLPKITPEPQKEKGFVDLRTVRFDNAQVTIQTIAKGELVTFGQLQIDSNWQIIDPNKQNLKMQGTGRVFLPNLAAIAEPPNPEQLQQAIAIAQNAPNGDMGKVSFDVDWDLTKGTGNVDLQAFNLEVPAVQGFAVNAPVQVVKGTVNAQAQVAIGDQGTPQVKANAELFEGEIKAPQFTKSVQNITGKFSFDGQQFNITDLAAEYDFLKIAISGSYNEKDGFDLNLANTVVDLSKGINSFNLSVPVAIAGQVNLSGKVSGKLAKPSLLLNLSTNKPITIDRVNMDRFNAAIELSDAKTIRIKKLQAASAVATISGSGQILLPQKDKPAEILFTSNIVGVAEEFTSLYKTQLPINIGQVVSSLQVTGKLDNPQILAQIDAPNATYPARGEVLLTDGLATIRNAKVKFPLGEVGLVGTYNLASGVWKSQINSNGIPLSAFLNKQKGVLNGLINLRSDRGGFNLADITAEAEINLPQGLTELPDAIAANLTWDGKNLLVPALQVGNYLNANGKIQLAYNDKDQFPTGIAGIDLDLISRNVNINRLASLSSVIPPQATGFLNFKGKLSGAIENLRIAGAIQLDRVSLASLASLLPKGIATPSRGTLNFNGTINGAVTAPELSGSVRVADVRINQLQLDNAVFNGSLNGGFGQNLFAKGKLALMGLRLDRSTLANSATAEYFNVPRLSGDLDFNRQQGLNVDLRGDLREDGQLGDRLALQLDPAFRPLSLDLRLNNITAIANRLDRNPNRISLKIDNLPLAILASLAGQNDVSGNVSSNLVVDIDRNSSVIGEVKVDRPRFGRLVGDRVIANLSYINGIVDIKNGKLSTKNLESSNEYGFNLTYNPNSEDQLVGDLQISKGKIQDLFATLQWANIVDITQGIDFAANKAVALQPVAAIQMAGVPLYQQLQYIAQLTVKQEQQEVADSSRNLDLPPLSTFNGELSGKIGFALNQRQGLRLNFDVNGKDLDYNKYAIETVQITGSYVNGIFAIAKANLQAGQSYGRITDARIRITDDPNPLLRFREQSGRIELKDFAIENIKFLPALRNIAIPVKGKVNGNVAVSGSNLFDLKIDGNLSLTDGEYNQQPISFAAIKFNYNALNVNFDASMKIAEKDSIFASGNVGVFGNFRVKLDIQDEGIALINVLNQNISWVDGKGKINLLADGTFRDPKISGKMTINDGHVQVSGLPGDFTNVQGDIEFTRDRLTSNITSDFSAGKLVLNGILPISDPKLLAEGSPEYEQALAVNADKLKLNVRDISSDNFNSRIIVRGSLLSPVLTGEVSLDEGRFVIGNDADPNTSSGNSDNEQLADITFDRLAVKLRNVQVTRFPIFNFLGEGTLIVNGTLQRPEPEGRIMISRGQFNAISARFRLDRAYENFAEFRPSQGLNPNLNVRVSGSVAEITRVPINSNRPNDLFSPNEIPASNLGAQRTLRVQAAVTGTALAPDIRLSSSPPRNQAEIVALIGGGILQQQGGSDPASALANLAGGTVLNLLQDAIGDALNLAEFNLSPVTTSTSEGSSTGALGLSAEAAIDLSNSFSVAVQRVINDATQPTNFAIRYRVDPNVLLRGNYSSTGRTGVSIEYETRF
ncbi:MAG: translocation/assembly module TamB domain-containing protein [Pseudanabaenaceae cyanobacterium bins.39]|nr:translocation/assembly module TamB domain-containing protein [Pseudanabaenaceae cyanobacterium bins.39]